MIKSKGLPYGYDLIQQMEEICKIKEYEVEGYNKVIQGALVVGKLTEDGWPELCSYSKPGYYLQGNVARTPTKLDHPEYRAFFCISSIDDSGISIFGPNETVEKALVRFEKLLSYFESCSGIYEGIDKLNEQCILCGMYAEVW